MKDTGQRIQTEDNASDIAIKVEHVSKTFSLPHNRQNSLKGSLINLVKGGERSYEKQEVLKDVSFEIKKGEFFGIVGRNGSGKSTLLKMLAGIYKPTKGKITVNGSLTPFIELGVGFNPDLTGRENVFLNGALLGFSNKEVEAMYKDIVDFAELERFMDQKLKNYSSGMQVRLAFSIAIRAKGDILLLDEVLAVGDEAFQTKCYDYFDDLKRNKKTVVLVTHDMSAVEKFCNRAILIGSGKILENGKPAIVAHEYSELFNDSTRDALSTVADTKEEVAMDRWGDGRLKVQQASVFLENPKKYGSPVVINMKVVCHTPVKNSITVAYAMKDSIGQKLFGDKVASPDLSGMKKGDSKELSFTFPNILNKGRYFIDLSLYEAKEDVYCDCWIDCVEFTTKTSGVNGYPIVVQNSFQEIKR